MTRASRPFSAAPSRPPQTGVGSLANDHHLRRFRAVDIRIGRITRAEPFPEARKPAYRLWVDFGPEIGEKRSSAQITKSTTRIDQNSIGRQVLAVVNFPPRQIGKVLSEVLVLGVPDEERRGGADRARPRCSAWRKDVLMPTTADHPPDA
jgi:tRNA-binding protein